MRYGAADAAWLPLRRPAASRRPWHALPVDPSPRPSPTQSRGREASNQPSILTSPLRERSSRLAGGRGERSSRRFVVARCSNARLSPARPRRHYRAPRKARDTHRIYTQVHIDHKLAESAVLFERHLRDSVLPVLCRARPATATGQLPTVDCSHCGKSGIDCANSGTFTDLEEAAHTRTSS